jgi:hypothetical protein
VKTNVEAGILELTIDELWELLKEHQNKEFLTAKKLPFTYEIRGGEMFVDRRSKSITKATFQRALEKMKENPEKITGPKSLNVFGAPYILAVLKGLP